MLCVPVPTAEGVYVTEQDDEVVVGDPRVHDVPGLEKAPGPDDPKLTEPVGADFVPEAVSVTVAVQTDAWFTATEAGEHETAVEVERCASKVTVSAGFPPRVAVQGLVVPLHVLRLRFA